MTTEQASPAPPRTRERPVRRLPVIATTVLVLAAIGFAAANASRGVAGAARVANPAVSGAPRPVRPLLGWTHWLGLEQTGTIVVMVALAAAVIYHWRRRPRHPILLMVLVTTLIVWQDPAMNWAPYAVYNPQLWHVPVDWPLASLSPTVEPFVVLGYAMFYLGPFFPARWLLRRVQARRPPGSFAWRHPLVTLGLLILGTGFIIDALLEIFLIRTQLYVYSQVMPFGSVFAGTPGQFPLFPESVLVTVVMIPAGVLLYRDQTGRTQAEKLARRVRAFRGYPALGTFAVMFAILNVAYFCYGAGFAVIRDTGAATTVACPWPFPEAKVYDPQGRYAAAGQPGPYSAGFWDGWESAQAGRPAVTAPTAGGRCGAGHG